MHFKKGVIFMKIPTLNPKPHWNAIRPPAVLDEISSCILVSGTLNTNSPSGEGVGPPMRPTVMCGVLGCKKGFQADHRRVTVLVLPLERVLVLCKKTHMWMT